VSKKGFNLMSDIIVYREPTPEEMANSTEELPRQEDFKGRFLQFITASSDHNPDYHIVQAVIAKENGDVVVVPADRTRMVILPFSLNGDIT
jgi:hypothetical protein